MIHLWYCECLPWKKPDLENCINILPPALQEEVRIYRRTEDQASRLTARLMVKKAIEFSSCPSSLWLNWNTPQGVKPVISGWVPFSIAHSGNLVVLAFGGQQALGVDVEKESNTFDTRELSMFFCESERLRILASSTPEQLFFELWTRKEAILKATGTGITEGLDKIDCRTNAVNYLHQTWHLHKITLRESYASSLAVSVPEALIQVQEIPAGSLL
jgi:4'-phosphopantetheinyl transferase